MSTIKKPDYTIFAKDAKSDELQPFPNISRGWGITLEQTAGMPPLEWANYIQKRTDEWLMYLTQNGLAEWDESLDYSKGALSQVDGVIYRAKEAVKGESPTTSAKWEKLLADKVGDSDSVGASQKAIKAELDKKISTSSLTQTITSDSDKAPSNLAVKKGLTGKRDTTDVHFKGRVISEVDSGVTFAHEFNQAGLRRLAISLEKNYGPMFYSYDESGSLRNTNQLPTKYGQLATIGDTEIIGAAEWTEWTRSTLTGSDSNAHTHAYVLANKKVPVGAVIGTHETRQVSGYWEARIQFRKILK